MVNAVQISSRWIGPHHPCFIIAEAGVNHNGDMALAHRLIDAAVITGADCVKFQSFVTESLVTVQAPKAKYQNVTTGSDGPQWDMLKKLELTMAQQAELKAHCERAGILYLCTPYEVQSVDGLDALGVAAFKIASTDATNVPLLRYIASKGRPVILSTGMCSMDEVEAAVSNLLTHGLGGKIILLHCTSEYPAPVAEANLRAMHAMQATFDCPVGYSDHTQDIGVSPWAVAAGACVIEKHFTLDCQLTGPDHRASLEPASFKMLVETIRRVEASLGDGDKRSMPSELPNKPLMQKSLVAARALRRGEVITAADIACKRPGFGITPLLVDTVVGKAATQDIPKDGFLTALNVDIAVNAAMAAPR